MYPRSPEVLLANDDSTGPAVLQRHLLDAGYEVQLATSGRDVLWYCSVATPDVIILDVDLPDMDGFEVCAHLRHHTVDLETAVIFVSAVGDAMTRGYLGQMVDYAGGDYFFAKPYDVRLLVRLVDEVLRERASASGFLPSNFPTRVVWPTSRRKTGVEPAPPVGHLTLGPVRARAGAVSSR